MKLSFSKHYYYINIIVNTFIGMITSEKEYLFIKFGIGELLGNISVYILIMTYIFITIYGFHYMISGGEFTEDVVKLYKKFMFNACIVRAITFAINTVFFKNVIFIIGFKEMVILIINIILFYKVSLNE